VTPLPALALLMALAQGGGNAPTLEIRPSSTNVSIGERFQVTVEAHGPQGTTYQFPKTIADGSVELIQSRALTGTADAAVYDAQVFAIGKDARVPPFEVAYKSSAGVAGTVTSEPVPINVVSSLDPEETNPAPADFAPPQPVFVTRAFWAASAVAATLLLAGLFVLFRRLRFPRKPADPVVAVAITPEEEAITGLERLAASRSALGPREFYIQLIQLLKQYLERRLEAPVLEMTSTETLQFVKAHDWTAPHAVA
jgi:hypothetical protein